MPFETILFDVEDGVASVTLNRPERMNAWNDTLAGELRKAMTACDRDDTIRSVVVTGAGRAFCAGADLSGGGDSFRGRGDRRTRRGSAPAGTAATPAPSRGRSASPSSQPSTAMPSGSASPTP